MTTNSGITKEWVDETVKPGDDFFRHVNGKWLATHEIPADRPKDGGLYTLRDNAEKHVRELVEKIAKEQPESRIGALYNSFMDVEKIEADGLEPLLKEIAPILNSATPSHLAVTLVCRSCSPGTPATTRRTRRTTPSSCISRVWVCRMNPTTVKRSTSRRARRTLSILPACLS